MAAHRAGSAGPTGAYRPPRRTRSTGEIINGVVGVVGRLAAVVFLLALAFTLFGAFSGGLKDYPAGYTADLSIRLSHNTQLAGAALVGSGAVLTLCIIILLWGWEFAIPLFLLAGALLYIGLPYLAIPRMSEAALSLSRAYHPGAEIVQAWRATGMMFFGAGGLFLLGWAWEQLQASLAAPRRAGGGLKVPFYSACWQTHFCKSEINHLCAPGRKNFRKSCWRHKSGCFCDESIGDKVLASARQKAGPDAAKWFGPRAAAPAPTFADHFRSTHHRVEGQRIACADCPIYNFHELQKHRILTPVTMLVIPALMYYYGEWLHRTYQGIVVSLDGFALHLGFSAGSTRALTNQIHSAFDVPVVEYMIYGLACVLILTLAARFLEWLCFSAKL